MLWSTDTLNAISCSICIIRYNMALYIEFEHYISCCVSMSNVLCIVFLTVSMFLRLSNFNRLYTQHIFGIAFWSFFTPLSLSQALERLSFGGSKIRDTVVAQSKILLFWYGTTYLLLEKNKPKYQPLEPPPLDNNKSHSKLEESNPEQDDQPLEPTPVSQVESETNQVDPAGSFILEGL